MIVVLGRDENAHNGKKNNNNTRKTYRRSVTSLKELKKIRNLHVQRCATPTVPHVVGQDNNAV